MKNIVTNIILNETDINKVKHTLLGIGIDTENKTTCDVLKEISNKWNSL